MKYENLKQAQVICGQIEDLEHTITSIKGAQTVGFLNANDYVHYRIALTQDAGVFEGAADGFRELVVGLLDSKLQDLKGELEKL